MREVILYALQLHFPKYEFWFITLVNAGTHTANIYSQFTVIGCVTCATVIWQWLLQSTTVQITFNETEEYSLKSIAISGFNVCSQITVVHITQPKAQSKYLQCISVIAIASDAGNVFVRTWCLCPWLQLTYFFLKLHGLSFFGTNV